MWFVALVAQLVYLANDILFHAQRQRPDAGPASWAADPVAVELRNALAVMVCATSAHANTQVTNTVPATPTTPFECRIWCLVRQCDESTGAVRFIQICMTVLRQTWNHVPSLRAREVAKALEKLAFKHMARLAHSLVVTCSSVCTCWRSTLDEGRSSNRDAVVDEPD